MSAATEGKSSKKAIGGDVADIYTALLGLALLVLVGTVGVVCFKGYQLFGSIFGVVD